MPSKHMLTWAQHIARHARAQGTPSDPPADSLQAHEQPGQPRAARASAQSTQSTSTGKGDPFAFDASAFGMGASAGEAQGQEAMPPQPIAAATSSHTDPFAFDMGAFGIALEPEPPSSADTQLQDSMPDPDAPALAPDWARTAAQDPYVFDMGASGMGGLSAASAGGEAASSAPAGAPHDQDGEAETVLEGDPARLATHADPYAFDMGVFGMAAHTEEQPVDSTLQASAPEAEHLSSAAQQDENTAGSAAHADPFAFDMGAFGMSGLAAPEEARIEHNSTGQSSARMPVETGGKTGADPFAFDPGAFGLGMPGVTAAQGTNSGSAPSPAAAQASQQQDVLPSSTSSAKPAQRAWQTEDWPNLAGAQQTQPQGLRQHQQKQAAASQAVAGSLSPALPEQEAFNPLTEAEVQQLEQLLSRAARLDDGGSANGKSDLFCLSGTVSSAHTPWSASDWSYHSAVLPADGLRVLEGGAGEETRNAGFLWAPQGMTQGRPAWWAGVI